MEAELKEWGNSLGIIIPAEKLKKLGIRKGDKIEIDIVQKKRVDGFGLAKGKRPFVEEKEPHEVFW